MPLGALAGTQNGNQTYKVLLLPPASDDISWPEQTPKNVADEVRNDFIQCDMCQRWYHCGCLGIRKGHPALNDDDMAWWCPMCLAGPPSFGALFNPDACAHPACTLSQEDAHRFVLERIVGRRPSTNPEKRWSYLIKWAGYSIPECSWEPLDTSAANDSFVREFQSLADSEGFDISPDNKQTILLKEAKRGGWT